MMVPTLAGLALALGTAVQAPAAAQDVSPWMPFVGCWEDEGASRRDPITCVLPVEGDPLAADLVGLREGKEFRRSRLRADGTVSAIESAECEGKETSRFSLDATRVYLQGELACGGGGATRTVSMLAISPEARLIYVSGRDVAEDPNVSVRALRGIPWARLPKSVRDDLASLEAVVFATRTAASRVPLSTAAIVETSRSMGAPVSEIWLAAVAADSPMWTPLEESAPADLEASGVPARVVALLAALENPDDSRIILSADGAKVLTRDQLAAQLELQRTVLRVAQAMSDGDGGTWLARSGGAGASPANVCSFLAGIFFGSGGGGTAGFGAASNVSLQGARQLMLNGCQNFAVGDPRIYAAVYGAYPGSTAGHAGSTRPTTAPMGHPAPEPLPLGGLGPRSAGGPSAAAAPRSTPPPSSASGAPRGDGMPVPVRTP